MAALMREKSGLLIDKDRILVRKTATRSQLVLPKKFHALIYRELHEEMGHLGVERTLHLVHDRFYWPHMQRDIEHYVTKVCSCLKHKKQNRPTRAPLQSIVTMYPFELVATDYLHLEKCKCDLSRRREMAISHPNLNSTRTNFPLFEGHHR